MNPKELKEILKLAAIAYGLTPAEQAWPIDADGNLRSKEDGAFRPDADDGDALRLAVKLGMTIHVDLEYSRTHVKCNGHCVTAPHNDDAEAATRCAIVYAAAEIGRAMP